MARFLSKHLGKVALMTAAALWASCSDAKEEKPADNSLNESKPVELSNSTKSLDSIAGEQYEEQNFHSKGISVHISKLTPVDEEPNQDLDIIKKVILSKAKVFSGIHKSFFKNDSLSKKISFDISLDKRGKIEDVVIKSTRTDNDYFDKSLVDYLKQIRFRGANSSTFTLNFEFYIPYPMDSSLAGFLYGSPGNIEIITKTSATFNESDIVIADGCSLTAEEIYETTRKRIHGLRHIYRKYLKEKPEFDGMVVLNLKIAASGAVENVDVKSSTTGYQEFDAEIAKQISQWEFPKSKTGGNVTIPFTFYESH